MKELEILEICHNRIYAFLILLGKLWGYILGTQGSSRDIKQEQK